MRSLSFSLYISARSDSDGSCCAWRAQHHTTWTSHAWSQLVSDTPPIVMETAARDDVSQTQPWTHLDPPRGFTSEPESILSNLFSEMPPTAMETTERSKVSEGIGTHASELPGTHASELTGRLIIDGCPGKHLFGHCLVQSFCMV